MSKWFVLFVMAMLMPLAGCGSVNGTEGLAANYVGLFKSIRTSNESTVIVTITADNGVDYEGTIDKLPVKGKWGVQEGDQLGLVIYQLDKGSDTNFLDFMLSIAGTVVSGTALRQ